MLRATKKALLFVAAVSAVLASFSPVAVSALAEFAIGDINIKGEFAEDQAAEPEAETQTLSASTEKPAEPEAEVTSESAPVIVAVKEGDTLSKIAKAHGTEWKRLYDANEAIKHPDVINPGDEIRIPSAEEVLASRALPAAPAKPAAKTQAGTAKSAPAPSAAAARMANDGSVWYQLALCESGGRPNVVSSNGLYHGLYQFLPSTWRSVGGSGLPSQASAEEQTMRAQMLQARSGWGQWPACARKLGLI